MTNPYFAPITDFEDDPDCPDFIRRAIGAKRRNEVDYLPTLETLAPYREALLRPYIQYCQTVSRRSMAINIETATYIAYLVDHLKPSNAVDFGSGFTSYTLRRFVDNVTSVDDDADWLRRSEMFARSNRVNVDRFVLWDDFDTTETFGFAVNDFSSGATRDATFDLTLAVCPGPVIFDDANSDHYPGIVKAAGDARRTIVDIRHLTEDMIHRYAVLVR